MFPSASSFLARCALIAAFGAHAALAWIQALP